jgi:type IV secretion system protein VirD4
MKNRNLISTLMTWVSMLALVLLGLLEILWSAIYSLIYPGHKHAHGNDAFLGPWRRLMDFKPTNKGIVLGLHLRLSLKRSYQGCIIVAPVGQGKTTAMIVPNILDCEGSLIVTDPSGEVFELTAGHLESQGYKIQVLNTSEIEKSFSYNPLARVTNEKEAKQIADILIECAHPNSKGGDDGFWNAGGSMAIYLLIRILMNEDPKYKNLHNLKHLLDSFGSGEDELDQLFIKQSDNLLFSEYKSFIAHTDKVKQGFLSTAKTSLEKFSDPELCKLCSGKAFPLDLKGMRQEKTATFIMSREDKIPYYSFIYRMLYAEVFENLMNMPAKDDLPVFLFLDEFANVGKLPNFQAYATTIRKRRVSMMVVLQELSQLEALYGKQSADTILFGGMANKVFYPGLGHETTKRISEMLGTHPAHYKDDGHWHVKERPLMTATEVRTMHDDEALYIYANKRPLKIHLLPFFKSHRMRKLVEIPSPEIKSGLSSITLEYLPIPIKPNGPNDDPTIPEIDINL